MKLKKPQSVEEYIELNTHFSDALKLIREMILETDLEESVKWMFPVYGYGKKNVLSLAAFKDYVGVWFFQGVFLKDDVQVLQNAQEGKTKAMRQWRFADYDEIKKNKSLLNAYIHEAIQNQKDGKELPVKRSTPKVIIPPELKTQFDKDPKLKASFMAFSLSKQKEYCEYISGAKREATKVKRLEKIIPMILSNVGLNDKYK